MLVRVCLPQPQLFGLSLGQALALTFATLLAPSAVLAFTITLWRLAADLR